MKSVYAPHLGRNVLLGGRKKPIHGRKIPHLEDYLSKKAQQLPTPPSSLTYNPAAETGLRNVYDNDTLGDCTVAALCHLQNLWTAGAGSLIIPTNAQVLQFYEGSGYNPSNPNSDNGWTLEGAIQWLMQNGYPDDQKKIVAYVSVDVTNWTNVIIAAWLFGLDFGVDLPAPWISPFPNGDNFIWDVAGAADPDNGHSFASIGYTATGITIDTWGLFGTITKAAVQQYCIQTSDGEILIPLSQETVNSATQLAPSGFNWSQLAADFDAFGGTVPVPNPPAPSPSPSPTPAPSTEPTLAACQQASKAAIAKLGQPWNPFVLKTQAELAVNNALAAVFNSTKH